jgi:hypothetical protein
MNMLKQKVAHIAAISLGYFIFSKNHIEIPKVAQLAKNHPISSQSSIETLEICESIFNERSLRRPGQEILG